jgi:hypothetical protein
MRVFKRVVAAVAVAGAVSLAFSASASAHVPTVSATCGGLQVSLVQYEQWRQYPAPPFNNVVQVNIDGVVQQFAFAHEYSNTFVWDQTVAHSWAVKINANLQHGDATRYDAYYSGTQQPCQQPTTTTAAPTTSTTQPCAGSTGGICSSPTTTGQPPTDPTPCAAGGLGCPTTTTSTVAPATTVPVPTSTAAPLLPATGPSAQTRDVILACALMFVGIGWCLIRIHRAR